MSQAQKQALIGELIAGVLVKEGAGIVKDAVTKGLKKVADRPDTKTDSADVKKAAPVVAAQVEQAVVKEAQAQAEHKFDAEDHWRSRNIWGSIVAFVAACDVIYRLATNGQLDSIESYFGPIGVIVGVLTPLYSRFIAKKPLFR